MNGVNRQHRLDPCKIGRLLLVVVLPAALLLACGAGQKMAKKQYVMETSGLASGMNDQKTMAHPLGKTDTFSILDPQVYSYIRIKDLSGNHQIRWEWLTPSGAPYFRTPSSPIQTSPGNYRKYVTAWNSIPIHGSESACYPGQWTVNVYLDDEKFVSDQFRIADIDVDNLRGFSRNSDSDKYGLVIGIENYSNLPKVNYAVRDAKMFKEYLIKKVGVPERNIIVLLDNKATKGDLEGMLTDYLPKNLPKSATLYIYYSGHGYAPSDGDKNAYLVAYEGNPRYISTTGYKLDKFYKDVDALNIDQAIVFVDSCFSGAVPNTTKNVMVDPTKYVLFEVNIEDNISALEKVVSLNSSTGAQVSLPYDAKKHSLFSYFLFKGLYGTADLNRDNEVTLQELYIYTKTNVDIMSRRIKGDPQTPVIIPGLDRAKDIRISKIVR